ncbi:DUF3298 domain-containing protein [Metasolibacillus meyeri]|uniref:DUF3298 domain-containing protein n=1 Tax=Metasolibacillus meyeri TaxID=1071052 RepID=A0AAW9NPH5_9BACL|nr:DUF3298 domain-containing protein [Metasolibacillus meyeri]MEC1180724.1 DUF3298 domain-containing protein [Metasolibacillus meyeri]
MDERLKKLEKQYKDMPIPENFDSMVEASLKQRPKKRAPKWILGAVAATAIFTAGLNINPAMAKNLVGVPLLGDVVSVLTFVSYEVEEDTYSANINVPKISGKSEEIAALNEKYAAEGKALFEQFKEDVDWMNSNDGGHLGVDSGYIIETDTDQILSIGRYVVEMVGSSSTVMQYDTIDKQKEIVITLPSLFKDDAYVQNISTYIAEQMREEMKATNQDRMYWVSDAGLEDESLVELFTTIKADQNFYITAQGKLVVVFDKYEVAPGYMGIVEFEIPTDLLQDSLVSNEYIR